ncbi:hypothetical protein NQZ79_g4240 [Umbelopsis isabellina]|nr:hypothetical protein NQZ79_g4240 [Umbelopsis isabellina]
MAGHYVIAGKAVPNHVLAMGFIGAYAALGVWASSGSSKPKPAEPPIKAASGDEEAFIKEFLAKAESEDKQ